MTLKGSRYNIAVDTADGTNDVLLYNTATSGLVRVDASTFDGLRGLFGHRGRGLPDDHAPPAPTDLAPELLDTLTTSGFLVPRERDEVGVLRRAFVRARQSKDLSFVIGMSMACNFDCPYCFEEHRPEHMSRSTAAAVRRFILERVRAAGARSVYINWFGGEPLLASEVLIELSSQLSADSETLGFRYDTMVITNGALLDGEMARRLASAGVGRAQVTIDGPRDVHDRRRPFRGGQPSYDRILSNLREAHTELRLRIRVNVDRDNQPHVPQLVRELGAAGLLHGPHAAEIYVGKVTSYTAQVESPGELLSVDDLVDIDEPVHAALQALNAPAAAQRPRSVLLSVSRGGCSATREHSFVIGSRGQLFKCELGIHDDRQAVGSVHPEGEMPPPRPAKAKKRLAVLGGPSRAAGVFGSAALDWARFNPYDQDKCRTCQFVPVCKSGCPKVVMEGEADDTICRFWDDSVGDLVRRLAAE